MPVTSLKLPDDLKQRVARLVADTDQSAHAFMIEAIERQTALAEARKRFVADALAAEKSMLRAGKAYAADDVHRYMRARAAGERSEHPESVMLRRKRTR